MNTKAQGGPIYFMFMIGIFILIWFVWLGGFVGTTGRQIVEDNGYTGIEAFFYSNLNLVIFIILVLAILSYGFFTGG